MFVAPLLAVIVTSELEDSTVSVAVSRNTYVPAVENVAVVLSALAFAKLTVPGPLNFDQVAWRIPLGRPSSVAVPERFAPAGKIIVWGEPALTTGAAFVFVPVPSGR